MSAPAARAALFDMDRTLVRVNTAPLYVRWQFTRGEATRVDVARTLWWVAQYTFGVIDAETIAARAALAMRGRDEASFRKAVRDWVHEQVLPHVGPAARAEVERRRAEGYECAILTSSTIYAAEPVAEALGIEHVIASRLEVVNGSFTGYHLAPLCYGRGKVLAAERWAAARGIDLARSLFYSDSISDLPMLERVGDPVVVNPDPRLWWTARRRGWRVERW